MSAPAEEHDLVSVIIPCRDYGRYLGAAVDSVLAQTYPNVEIIAVDDGSSDETGRVLAEYGSAVRVVRHESPQGCGAARNHGLQLARGELCLFLDADDYLDPLYLEKTVPVLWQTGAGVVYCSFYQVYPDRRTLFVPPPYQRRELAKDNYMAVTSLTRARLVRAVGGFDNRLLIQDYDLWLRVTHLAGGALVPEPLFTQTIHGGNMSVTMPQSRRLADIRRIKRRIRYGIFLRSGGGLYLVTGVRLRHPVPEEVLGAAGLDRDDVFEVEPEILETYLPGPPLDSLSKLEQAAVLENRW